jgi:hypothetical protein
MEQFKQFTTTNAETRWPSTVGRERYWFISTEGRVKVTNNYNSEIKWPTISPTGGREGKRYAALASNIGGKYIHKIVANAFLPPKPEDGQYWVVDHIDNNRLNNCLSNLQWLTNVHNVQKGFDLRKEPKLQTNDNYQELYTNLLGEPQRAQRNREIISLYVSGTKGTEITKLLGLSKTLVWKVIGAYRSDNNITTYNK